MPRYIIATTVEVDVEMSVEAASVDEARKIFRDGICMTASLLDTPEARYDVSEDSISDVGDLRVSREKE